VVEEEDRRKEVQSYFAQLLTVFAVEAVGVF
jgi:hypothetical protein